MSDKNDNGRTTNNVVNVVKTPTITINKPAITQLVELIGRETK